MVHDPTGDSKGAVHHSSRRGIALLFFLTSALDRGGWSVPCPGCFTLGNNLVPIVEEPGWAPPAFDGVGKDTLKIAVLSSWCKIIHCGTR